MKLTRKILASVLALVMVLLMLPAAFAAEGNTYVLDVATDVAVCAKGDKTDGETEVVHDYFTIHYSKNTRVEDKTKTFEDNYEGTRRLNFGGKIGIGDTIKNVVEINPSAAATVKIWWAANKAGREMGIFNAAGEVIQETSVSEADNAPYVTELSIAEAGKYYIGCTSADGCNYIFKIEVTEAAEAEVEVPTVEMQVGIGTIDATNPLSSEPISYTYTATENGKLTLAVAGGYSPMDKNNPVVASYSFNGGESVEMVTTDYSEKTYIEMVAGDTITVTAVVNGSAPRKLNARWDVAIEYEAELVLGNNPFYKDEDIVRTFTAPADGTLTIKCAKNGGFGTDGEKVVCSYTINDGEIVVVPYKNAITETETEQHEIALFKGDVIVITVESMEAGGTLTASWAEAEVVIPELVVDGTTKNPVNNNNISYTYTAPADGTLTLTCSKGSSFGADTSRAFGGATGAAAQNFSYTVNGGTAVKITNGKATDVELKKDDVIVITADAGTTGSITASWAEAEAPCQHTNKKVEGAVEATCTEAGFTGNTVCADCGEKLADGEEIAALDHDYVDGYCTRCNNPETGDVFGIMVALMAASGTALVCLKKKEN